MSVIEPITSTCPPASVRKINVNPEMGNPLNRIDVSDASKVAAYFPHSSASIATSVQAVKDEVEQGLKTILGIPAEQKSFHNTFHAIDTLQTFLQSKTQALHIVAMTNPNKEVRHCASDAQDRLKALFIDNFQCSKELYQACQQAHTNVQTGRSNELLSDQQQEYLRNKILSSKREGFHLSEGDFALVKDLKVRISTIETTFLKNLDDDKSHFWVSLDELKGVPDYVIANLEKKDDQYKVTCDYPTYFPIIDNCEIESTRRKTFIAFNNRAAEVNLPLLKDLISARDQLASILGYASFADYDLEDQMAKSVQRVEEFIHDIALAAQAKAKVEISNMVLDLPESVKLTAEGQINPWDIRYLYERTKKKVCNVNEAELQEFFSFKPTLEKLLVFYSNLFQLEFQQVSANGLWDASVHMVAVYTKDDPRGLAGHIILDLFPREGKYGHGYCVDVLAPSLMSNGDSKPAIAVVIGNFTPEGRDRPSLLLHEDVLTLFHEFGHGLHQLLGRAEMPSLSGYHTKTDFLELPSLLMEEMLWDAEAISYLAEHYQTKAKIPESLLQAKLASKSHGEGYFHVDQMMKASLSLEYFKTGFHKNTKVIREEIQRRIQPFIAIASEDNYEGTFRHLADPLYRSKYYCYDWAQVFARDVFEFIKQKQGGNMWLSYRKQILEAGGGIDPNTLLRNFLARAPSKAAFLDMLRC